LDVYYEQTRVGLEPILTELNRIISNHTSLSAVDRVVVVVSLFDVVSVLQQTANNCIPKHTKNFYNFWWSQELTALKEKAIASCRMWKESGKPRHGSIHAKYIQDKLLYINRIRTERVQEINSYTNELHDALLHKSGHDFWKQWKSKFGNNSDTILQVDGIADSKVIVNNFAKHFEEVCTPFSAKSNEELNVQYNDMRLNYTSYSVFSDDEIFDAELVGNMNNGKTAGYYELLTSEHLQHSHPIVVVILCKLFNLFIATGHVPNSFGASYTVPIPKCNVRSKAQ